MIREVSARKQAQLSWVCLKCFRIMDNSAPSMLKGVGEVCGRCYEEARQSLYKEMATPNLISLVGAAKVWIMVDAKMQDVPNR